MTKIFRQIGNFGVPLYRYCICTGVYKEGILPTLKVVKVKGVSVLDGNKFKLTQLNESRPGVKKLDNFKKVTSTDPFAKFQRTPTRGFFQSVLIKDRKA